MRRFQQISWTPQGSGVSQDGNVGLLGITPRQHLSAAPVLSAARRFEGQARVPNRGVLSMEKGGRTCWMIGLWLM